MNKYMPIYFAKLLLILITVSTLLLNSVPNARACGFDPLLPVFSYEIRPDNLKGFAAGRLGILKPDYARSYLVVAYRMLNGNSLSKLEQEQILKLWNHRLGIDKSENENDGYPKNYWDNENQINNALGEWAKLRNEILVNSDDTPSINDIWKSNGNEFNSYINCTKSGFVTAVETLKNRIEKYSDETNYIKEWVRGQDAVFSNCSGNGMLPGTLENDAPLWLEKDREYQTAAALFYAGKLVLAKVKFEQISKDKSSVWQKISSYLVARTYLRMASLDKPISTNSIENAESHLLELLKDENMLEVHRISRELLYVVANRAKTKERFHKFSELLSNKSEISDMRNEIDNYTNYLDHYGFKYDEKPTVNIVEKKIESIEEKEQTFWEWICSWIWSVKETEKTEPFETVEEKVEKETPISYENEYEEKKLRNSMHFRSDINSKEISDIARKEDISDWIFTFQANDKEAFEHALEKWQTTSTLHWFLAAIANAEIEYDNVEKLIKHAERIDTKSPAFYSIKFHQVRLLIESNRFEWARTTLDAVLKKNKNRMRLSTQNAFFSQRILVAENLDVFLRFSKRKAIAYTRYSGYDDATSTIGNYGMETRGLGMIRWRNRWMFDKETTEIFNKKMPLKMLMKAGLNKNLPNYLRKGILISALTRAILLEQNTAKRKIAKDLIPLAPEMSKELVAFSETPNHLTTFKLLINYPLMRPVVDKGFGRFTIPASSLAYDRDNWWYRKELEIKNEYIDEPTIPQFLSKNDLKQAEAERLKIFNKGYTGEFLSEKAVLAYKQYPNQKNLAQLLYKTLQANRYGDVSYTDDSRRYTKAVFRTLHRKFPKSRWAKRSPIWY